MRNPSYNEKYSLYVRTLEIAIKVSQLGAMRISDGNKMTWTCVLNTRLCIMGNSLLKLAPKKYDVNSLKIEWDYSSMFSLTRNIIECYQTLFYLCTQNISDDERFARKKLFDLHDYHSRKKMFSFTNDDIENLEIEKQLSTELSETNYFKNLDEKKQKYYLKGETAFFVNREDLEENMGHDKSEFKYLYKLFSSNTHSFPMGFYGMLEGERGTGVGTEIEVLYSTLALEIAELYIRKSSNDMIDLFPDIANKLNSEEKKALE